MKTLYQIQRECGVTKKCLERLIRTEKIKGTKKGFIFYYDSYQEYYIHKFLYLQGQIECVTFESIINKY